MLYYVEGDATQPQGDGLKIVAHVCNNKGAWGAGFVLAISKRWPLAELRYRALKKYTLGTHQFVDVEPGIVICNMIAQTMGGPVPLRYGALRKCLHELNSIARISNIKIDTTIHAPMFGAGLAGGDWTKIESIIKEEIKDVDIYIYKYKKPCV